MLEKADISCLGVFTYMTVYATKPIFFLDIVKLDLGCFMKFFVVVSTKELVNVCVRPSLLAKEIWRRRTFVSLENWFLRRVSSIVVEQFGCSICAVHPRPKNTDPTMLQ